jgi:hypothetical protein
MQVLTSGIDHNLDAIYEQFSDTFGIGPCGAYSAFRREQGWGAVAVCDAYAEGDEIPFTHYVIVQDGGIIDLTNPFGEELRYENVEILNADEMPECIGAVEIEWMRERLSA